MNYFALLRRKLAGDHNQACNQEDSPLHSDKVQFFALTVKVWLM